MSKKCILLALSASSDEEPHNSLDSRITCRSVAQHLCIMYSRKMYIGDAKPSLKRESEGFSILCHSPTGRNQGQS